MTEDIDLGKIARRGVELCRRGKWQEGLEYLASVAQAGGDKTELPGSFYSYLGYGIARFEGRLKEGLELCKHGVKIEFYAPENYYNLARTYLLVDASKRQALLVIQQGLAIDSKNRQLLRLLKEIDERRDPVFRFLPRGSALNRLLGKLRHNFLEENEA